MGSSGRVESAVAVRGRAPAPDDADPVVYGSMRECADAMDVSYAVLRKLQFRNLLGAPKPGRGRQGTGVRLGVARRLWVMLRLQAAGVDWLAAAAAAGTAQGWGGRGHMVAVSLPGEVDAHVSVADAPPELRASAKAAGRAA